MEFIKFHREGWLIDLEVIGSIRSWESRDQFSSRFYAYEPVRCNEIEKKKILYNVRSTLASTNGYINSVKQAATPSKHRVDSEQKYYATYILFNSRPKLIDLVFVLVVNACVLTLRYSPRQRERKFIIAWSSLLSWISLSTSHIIVTYRSITSFTCHISSNIII